MTDWAKDSRKPIQHPVGKIINKAIDERRLYGEEQFAAIAKYFKNPKDKVWLDDVLIEATKLGDFMNSWADLDNYQNRVIPFGISQKNITDLEYSMFKIGYEQAIHDIIKRFSKFHMLLKFYEEYV